MKTSYSIWAEKKFEPFTDTAKDSTKKQQKQLS